MRSTPEYLLAVLAELKAIREGLHTRHVPNQRAARAVKPATLAADLGRHPRTIIRAIEDGRIAATPCGRSWSITRQEAERIKREGLGPPTPHA